MIFPLQNKLVLKYIRIFPKLNQKDFYFLKFALKTVVIEQTSILQICFQPQNYVHSNSKLSGLTSLIFIFHVVKYEDKEENTDYEKNISS